MSGTTGVFREHRRLLIGVAYRVLGSVTDAEDVVQESWLRWSKVDQREASSQGDLDSLTSLLARDVALVSDGGGKARSPLRIIVGTEKVIRFFAGISTEHGTNAFLASIGIEPVKELSFAMAEINAAPALVVYAGAKPITFVSLVVADGRIAEIYLVANPEKLEHLTAA